LLYSGDGPDNVLFDQQKSSEFYKTKKSTLVWKITATTKEALLSSGLLGHRGLL
jgi:hypothetical protein